MEESNILRAAIEVIPVGQMKLLSRMSVSREFRIGVVEVEVDVGIEGRRQVINVVTPADVI